jgi:hypothetical protein
MKQRSGSSTMGQSVPIKTIGDAALPHSTSPSERISPRSDPCIHDSSA